MVTLTEPEIRKLVDVDDARIAIADAFRALHRGEATLGTVISLPFARPRGFAHVKAGHVHTETLWTVKVSADFYPDDGNPTVHSGLMLVLSSEDGSLVGLLADNGYLTEMRTGAAGAVAADLLARPDASTVAIVGAGNQARYQLEALLRVRPIERVRVASRTRERAQAYVDEVASRFGLAVELCDSVEEAVRGADVVVTVTPSAEALVHADWLDPGTHVTAVGSDEPTKQELAPDVLARAHVIAADHLDQASRLGELHHAVAAGACTVEDAVTLGELLEGAVPGRATAEDVTVADLTGVGVQDAAIAAFVLRRAASTGLVELAAQAGAAAPDPVPATE